MALPAASVAGSLDLNSLNAVLHRIAGKLARRQQIGMALVIAVSRLNPMRPCNGRWRGKEHLDSLRSCWHRRDMSERIEDLRLAVETMHRCKVRYESSTPIRETFRRQTVREGIVESFAVAGHPKVKRCYAWSFQDKGEKQHVTALEIPPVESPITAVRVAIAAEARGKK
jgi:hypothetical protein